MAEEVAQEKVLNLSIRVYKDPENSLRYKADIKVNGWTKSTGGPLDRKKIIRYLDMTLQNAQAYLGFLERSDTEESRKMNYDILLVELEYALAEALAYEIGQDIQEDPCRSWREVGENWCATTECADFVKEDFEACMETCRKAWCETTPNERDEHPKSTPEGDANA